MKDKNPILAVALFRESYHVFRAGDNYTLKSDTNTDFKDVFLETSKFLKRKDLYSAISGIKEGNPDFEKLMKDSPRNIFLTKSCFEEGYVRYKRNETANPTITVYIQFDSDDYEMKNCERTISLGKYTTLSKFFEVIGVDLKTEEWAQAVLLRMEVENL